MVGRSGRVLVEVMENIVASGTLSDAVLSHTFPQGVEQLFLGDFPPLEQAGDHQHVRESRRLADGFFVEQDAVDKQRVVLCEEAGVGNRPLRDVGDHPLFCGFGFAASGGDCGVI